MSSIKKSGDLVLESSPFDVMMGRGKKSNDHPGNIRFRKLIVEMSNEYNRSHTGKRARMVDEVITQIHASGGRFVQAVTVANAKGEASAAWEVVSEEKALAKVKQALRDLGSTRKRRSSVHKQEAVGRDNVSASPEMQTAAMAASASQIAQLQQQQILQNTLLSPADLQLSHQQQQQSLLASLQQHSSAHHQPQQHGIAQHLGLLNSDPCLLMNHPLLQQSQTTNMFQSASSSWPMIPTNGFNNLQHTSLQPPPGHLTPVQIQQARQHFFREQQLRDILFQTQNSNNASSPSAKPPSPIHGNNNSPITSTTAANHPLRQMAVETTSMMQDELQQQQQEQQEKQQLITSGSTASSQPKLPQPKDDDDEETDDEVGIPDSHPI